MCKNQQNNLKKQAGQMYPYFVGPHHTDWGLGGFFP